MAYFPMFVQLKKKKCLVIGGGKIALRKIEVLKDFEADITVIAPEMITQIRQINQICRIFRTFMEKDFNEADFVIAATDDQKTNHEISQICRRKKIPVNAVDQKEDCSFIFPSYVKEGEVVGIIGKNGAGKSTLMKTLLRLIQPISGTIETGDGLSAYEVGYLPQQTAVQKDFPASVMEIVLTGTLNKSGWKPFYSRQQKND